MHKMSTGTQQENKFIIIQRRGRGEIYLKKNVK